MRCLLMLLACVGPSALNSANIANMPAREDRGR